MAKYNAYGQFHLRLPDASYPIYINRQGLYCPEVLRELIHSPQLLIITNNTIAPHYLSVVASAFSEKQCDTLILEDGEQYKNLSSLQTIFECLITHGHHRDTTIVALGGGVIGDIAGFAAATYQRGVKFVQIPTTLLAQVDSSIGGKTAINHAQGKNIIGSFYQPQAVYIDVNTLTTLPAREFRAGLGEIIKYGLLVGGVFLDELRQLLARGINPQTPELPKLIEQCCRIKASFVESDEKEQGSRALLNLGHTFAHALESYTQYTRWLHGEAVAIGLYCASLLSYEAGFAAADLVELVAEMLQNAELNYKIPQDINLSTLRDLMSLDKKVQAQRLRFILLKKPGDCFIAEHIREQELNQVLLAAVEGE
ncbi:MAG: 3-dehydroquinate synthase [Legionella sp.]|nr:3-dehydroquinate synthase [Legionella sp.]